MTWPGFQHKEKQILDDISLSVSFGSVFQPGPRYKGVNFSYWLLNYPHPLLNVMKSRWNYLKSFMFHYIFWIRGEGILWTVFTQKAGSLKLLITTTSMSIWLNPCEFVRMPSFISLWRTFVLLHHNGQNLNKYIFLVSLSYN